MDFEEVYETMRSMEERGLVESTGPGRDARFRLTLKGKVESAMRRIDADPAAAEMTQRFFPRLSAPAVSQPGCRLTTLRTFQLLDAPELESWLLESMKLLEEGDVGGWAERRAELGDAFGEFVRDDA